MNTKVWMLVSALVAVGVGCGGETSGSDDPGTASPGAGGSAGQGPGGAGTSGAGGSGAQAGSGGGATAGASAGGAAGAGATTGGGAAGAGQAGSGNFCAGKGCGDFCNPCGPNEKCEPHYCQPDGSCTVAKPSCGAGGSAGYEPCKGKLCGQPCDPCGPNVDCDVPGPTFCDESGACKFGQQTCGGTEQCQKNEDCPQFDNGTSGYCVDGKCVYVPIDPCQGKSCGAQCTTCLPGQGCPAVLEFCDAKGNCSAQQPVCEAECKGPEQCPVPEVPCKPCPDGTLSCPEPTCVKGQCGVSYPACGDVECKTPETCPKPKGPCEPCPDGSTSCPVATCENGKCGVEYSGCGGVQCSSPKECPVPDGCKICPDGALACPQATCEAGQCGVTYPGCASACSAAEVKGVGQCKKLLGFYWDGSSCQALNGCECAGDCKAVSATFEQCQAAHQGCKPQCASDADCPVPPGPCEPCPDGSVACPGAMCVGGQCQATMSTCGADCGAADAVGIGPCAAFLGYVWNGQQCVGIGGCSCQGKDCGELTSFEKCTAQHKGCFQPQP